MLIQWACLIKIPNNIENLLDPTDQVFVAPSQQGSMLVGGKDWALFL